MVTSFTEDENQIPPWLVEDDKDATFDYAPKQPPNENPALSKGEERKPFITYKKTYNGTSYGGIDDEDSEPETWGNYHNDDHVKEQASAPAPAPIIINDPIPSTRHTTCCQRPNTRRSCCHVFFILFSDYSLLALMCMLVSQGIPFLFMVPLTYLQIALRVGMVTMCLTFALKEYGVKNSFFMQSTLLNNWISRGYLYAFVGLVGIEESVAVTLVDQPDGETEDLLTSTWELVASYFITISAWMMVVSGGLYFLMGILCIKRLRDKCYEDYESKLQKEKLREEILAERGINV